MDTVTSLTEKPYLASFCGARSYFNGDPTRRKNVTCILVARELIPCAAAIDCDNLVCLSIEDTLEQDLIKWIDVVYEIIESSSDTIVACHAGISRSASLCIAYLMRKRCWSLSEALLFVKNKRIYKCIM